MRFLRDPRILKFGGVGGGNSSPPPETLFFFTLECIKTAVFDTRNPKSPYRGVGGGPAPLHTHPPLGQFAPSLKLSSSFFKYFLSHP